MKKSLILISLFLASSLFAEERIPLALQVPPDFYSKVCASPIWKDATVVWGGVQDRRTKKELGVVTKKKGKDPVYVYSDPPLDQLLNHSLRQLFFQCGMKIEEGGNSKAPQLEVFIDEFSAVEEKRILTGKGLAKSRLSFLAKRPLRRVTATVSYEIDFKMGRKRGIKRITQILNELFSETLKQVTKAPQLRDLK